MTPPLLGSLTLAELVHLSNQYAPKLGLRPVRRFRDKAIAVARVQAVLPRQKPLSSRAAPHLETVTALLARGATLGELMEATGASDAMCRRFVDQVRRRGHTVRRTGPKAWVINGY
jgi:hypothetical protein